MTAPARQEVLHRITEANKRRAESARVTPARAFRMAVCGAADRLWQLTLASHGIQHEILEHDEAMEWIADGDLLIVVQAEDGACGLVTLDPAVLSSLIEIQTLGKVLKRAPEDRSYTRTDAAMAWVYVSAVFADFAAALPNPHLAWMFGGFRMVKMADCALTAALFLRAPTFHLFSASVDIGRGQRTGDIRFLLPDRVSPDPPRRRMPDLFQGAAGKSFQLLPIPVEAVLCRLRLSLARVRRLAAGDVLHLPPDVLRGVRLVGPNGTELCQAELGQQNGFRAVRLAVSPAAASRPPPESGDAAKAAPRTESRPEPPIAELDAAPAPAEAPVSGARASPHAAQPDAAQPDAAQPDAAQPDAELAEMDADALDALLSEFSQDKAR